MQSDIAHAIDRQHRFDLALISRHGMVTAGLRHVTNTVLSQTIQIVNV